MKAIQFWCGGFDNENEGLEIFCQIKDLGYNTEEATKIMKEKGWEVTPDGWRKI